MDASRPRGIWLSAPAALILPFVLTFAASAPAATLNKILATVDGEPITQYQVNQFAARTIRGRQLGSVDQAAMLDALITERMVAKEVADKGIVVRDEDVDRYIEGIKERNKLDDAKLKDALAKEGLTVETYRTQIREDLQRQQLISREIRGKVSVTPEDVQRYYEAHLSEYSTSEKVQLAHILFRLEPDAPPSQVAAITAKAEEVRGRIAKGADFAEMAKHFSEDATASSGGELGWFKPGELLDEMEKVVARLDVGEVSDPVRTKLGMHLIKLQAKEGASHQQLEGLAEQIKQQLYNAALEERFQKWLTEELRKRHHVEMQ